jgi:hypothetical protein
MDVDFPSESGPQKCTLLVMELLSGGQMLDYVQAGAFPEDIARTCFRQMMGALLYA